MEHFGKKIHVNSSSLIDLKAELFRKQQEFKQNKLQTEAVLKLKGSNKADEVVVDKTVGVNKNKGIEKRNEKDLEREAEESRAIEKSRKALEAKAKIYDQLSKGGDIPEDANELYMVDFQSKVLQTPQFPANRPDSMIAEPATHSDDEWVDYVDSLGRSRKCLRKDLPAMIEMDANLASKHVGSSRPDLMSSDMEMELKRQVWEQEEMDSKPIGPVHYQNVKFDEIRNHGVGYFAFDTDETKRQEQMTMLNNMREQTKDLRDRKEKVKDKRKKLLEARLQKVKLRKKLKTASDGESGDEAIEPKAEEPIVSIPEPETSSVEVVKPQIVRPWDMGKPGVQPVIKKPFIEVSGKDWVEKKRSERPQEFAPPQIYYEDRAEQFLRKTFPHPLRNPANSAAGFSGNFVQGSSNQENTELDDIPLPNLPL